MSTELLIYQQTKQIEELYNKLQIEQSNFNESAQITCLAGCGKCCNNPEIEISPLEVYPWALDIIKNGESEKYLKILSEAASNICVFYRFDPNNHNNGNCGNYQFRPLICRLFGCSFLPDKFGKMRPILCKLIKNTNPNMENKINKLLAEGLNAPAVDFFYNKLSEIDPYSGNLRKPINKAYYQVLEKLCYLIDNKNLQLKE